jgi:hypothetical protein
LFTLILNNRLEQYCNDNDLIDKCQAGFLKGYSTADNLFVLNSLIEILRTSKKSLFCAFVDLKAAFDTIWREGLWGKLILNNINGSFLNVIKNMYEKAKSCIFVNGVKTDYFPCNVGVRQGENLSALLFSLYLNDLSDFINSSNIASGIKCNKHEFETEAINFVKLFILLYADDTVLMAETAEDLQNLLNIYADNCDACRLKLNSSKTKVHVLVFSRGRQREYTFTFNKSDQ